MGFDVSIVLVFVILGVELFALLVKEHRLAVNAVYVIFFP